jgi:hypothetical protein
MAKGPRHKVYQMANGLKFKKKGARYKEKGSRYKVQGIRRKIQNGRRKVCKSFFYHHLPLCPVPLTLSLCLSYRPLGYMAYRQTNKLLK